MKQILLLILPILFISEATIAQENVQGEIKDANGSALAGATIEVVGEKIYAIADDLGKFSITSQKDFPFSLLIRFVGYEPHEVEISDEPIVPINIILIDDSQLNEVVVSARRRKEAVQDVPIPISVVTGKLIADAGAFNVNRVKELVPSVQLYSSNPRNTGVSIRGLGTTFGLTNDGIDPGVGFYVDGVYDHFRFYRCRTDRSAAWSSRNIVWKKYNGRCIYCDNLKTSIHFRGDFRIELWELRFYTS